MAGLGLGLAGFVAILAQLALSGQSFADLPLASLLTAERLLPLFGLGLLFGQLRRRSLAISLVLLVAGAAAGIVWREAFFLRMAAVPGAGAHMFLTGPLACVLIGLPLVLPRAVRPWLALPLIAPASALLAIATVLGDPTLHAQGYLTSALSAEALLVAAVALVAAGLDRPWLSIAVRIFASWLIAIGLLYGGAHLASKRAALEPPPFPALPDGEEDHGFGPVLRQLEGGAD